MINMEISNITPNAYFADKPAAFRWELVPQFGEQES
jgi:hypothetical protein